MKTPILPILLGLSLCGVGGALLYVYYKKKDENQSDSTDSLEMSPLHKIIPPEISVEMTISNDIVPMIVGRASVNLKLIEEKTHTKIQFREKDDSNHICEIRGQADAVKEAQKIITKQTAKLVTTTEELLVPQSACGKIIGRCGEALHEICRKSLAKVSVDSGDRGDGNKRRVCITGTPAQVNTAKILIEEKVKEDAEARKQLEDNEAKREPRINVRSPSSNSSITETSIPREVLPPNAEKLNSTNSDGQMEVYVSAIASPSKFWVQMAGPQSTELDILVESMTEYYSKTDNQVLHKISDPYLGQIVAAIFKYDSKWYRAEVVAILPNEFKPQKVVLDLYFVDYGDSVYVEPDEIFELRTDFLTLRFQAIECYLAHVQPANSDDPDTWDQRTIERFEELTHVAQWKKMLSRVVSYKERIPGLSQNDNDSISSARLRREGSPIPGVELYDTTENGDLNIGMELVTEGLASIIDKFGDLNKSQVLRLDGGQTVPQTTTSMGSISRNNIAIDVGEDDDDVMQFNNDNGRSGTEDDRFSAICENTTNENYENSKRDLKQNGSLFLNSERSNLGQSSNNNGNVWTNGKLNNRNGIDMQNNWSRNT